MVFYTCCARRARLIPAPSTLDGLRDYIPHNADANLRSWLGEPFSSPARIHFKPMVIPLSLQT